MFKIQLLMLKKGTKLFSIINNKCPQCHNGDFFEHKATYNFKKVIKLKERCPSCNLKYMIEPSFFFGAMYVNYGIAVALAVAIFIISKVFLDFSILTSFIAIIIFSILLTPITIRLSRIIWINLFITYDKTLDKNDSRN